MLHRHLPAASVAALLLAFVPQPAHAATGPGAGVGCGYTIVDNPFPENGNRHVAELDAGPILVNDGSDPRVGRVTCTIRTDPVTHLGPELASATSLTTPGVVALPPTLVEFVASPEVYITLCTQVEIEGEGTFYYDEEADEWSTDPNVECDHFASDPPDYDQEYIDPLVCPVLAALSPDVEPVLTTTPEGDLYVNGALIWDCPPYWRI